jgi:hypothetical protein
VAAWLGRPVPAEPVAGVAEQLVLRYLRAFGPASVADMRTWSWLTGLRAVVDRVRPQLRAYRDGRGRELLDVADGELTDAAVEAPVRFLPVYDNLLLSHADRSRMMGRWYPDTRYSRGSILVDGFVAAGWHLERATGTATLLIDTFSDLAAADRAAVEAEGEALLGFLAADAASRAVAISRFD